MGAVGQCALGLLEPIIGRPSAAHSRPLSGGPRQWQEANMQKHCGGEGGLFLLAPTASGGIDVGQWLFVPSVPGSLPISPCRIPSPHLASIGEAGVSERKGSTPLFTSHLLRPGGHWAGRGSWKVHSSLIMSRGGADLWRGG